MDKLSEYEQLFHHEGKEINISSNNKLKNELRNVLFVKEGEIDLFVVLKREENGHSIEKLIYLYTIQKGQTIFPWLQDKSDIFVIGISNMNSYLIAIEPTQLKSLHLELHLQEWIEGITSYFSKFKMHHITYHLEGEKKLNMEEGETCTIPRFLKQKKTHWVKVENGSLSLLGIPSIILSSGEIVPLSSKTWLQSNSNETEIAIIPESLFLKKKLESLLEFHKHILEVIQYDIKQKEEFEKISLESKDLREQELLDTTLRNISSIFSDEQKISDIASPKPLLQACQIIGKVIHKTFTAPLISKGKNAEEKIYEISFHSHVHYRNVLLPKNWWEYEQGPFLGFIRKEKTLTPSALIFAKSNNYKIIIPEERYEEEIRSEEQAKKILPKATMFYRSFPLKNSISFWNIVHFISEGRWKDFFTILFVGISGALLSLFLPFANKLFFDEVIPFLDNNLFKQLLIGIVFVMLSNTIFLITRQYAVLRIGTFLNHDVETAIWQRVLDLPAQFFRRFTIGNLLQRIFSVQEIRKILSGRVIEIFLNGIFSLIYLLAMLYFSLTLSLVGLAVVFLGLIVTGICFFLSQKIAYDHQELNGKIHGNVIQMIFGLSKIRTNAAENRFFNFWANDTTKAQRLRLKMGSFGIIVNVVNSSIGMFKFLAIFAVIMSMISYQTGSFLAMSVGTFLAFNAAFVNFSNAISDLCNTLMGMVNLFPLWKRSNVILNEPIESGVEKIKPDKLLGDIRIDQLSFSYGKNTPLIHENVSINIKSGDFVAIVGPSGCGKSTLIRLLLGFETPTQGAIYFDGKNLSSMDLHTVRSYMGAILQNSKILDGSIRENILSGGLATEEEVNKAIEMSGLDEELKIFPMGLQTLLIAGGSTLSGGQRQKILLARSFLTKAPIIIWDEATNLLDNISQNIAIKNLEKLDATRIVVAHRLNSIKNADQIFVMDRGKFVEKGTFQELVNNKGLFASMLALQEKSNVVG